MLNNLPSKIVFVHNGILVENTRPTFDGFIETEFPKGGFERWDIEYLTKLFSEHLFNECLFCDDESYFLFNLKSASNLNGNLNCSKELEHYAS